MKTPLICAALGVTVLSSCVLPSPPSLVTVEERRSPVYVQSAPAPVVYSPGYTVRRLGPGYSTVRRGRTVYYQDRGNYYRRTRGGYVVVQRPY